MKITFHNSGAYTLNNTSTDKKISKEGLREITADQARGDMLSLTLTSDTLSDLLSNYFSDRQTEEHQEAQSLLNSLEFSSKVSMLNTMELIDNPFDFPEIANGLNEDDANKLMQALARINESPFQAVLAVQPNAYMGYKTRMNNFIDALSKMDKETVSHVLQYTDLLLSGEMSGEDPAIADDEFNAFIDIVSSDEAGNIKSFMTTLDKFNDEQKMNIFDAALYARGGVIDIVQKISSRSDEVKNSVLAVLAKNGRENVQESRSSMARGENSPNEYDKIYNAGGAVQATLHSGEASAIKLPNQLASLMDDYEFSDQQLIDMANDLSKLSGTQRVGYLNITHMGLDHLTGSEKSQASHRNTIEFDKALEVVKDLRTNKDVLNIELYKSHAVYLGNAAGEHYGSEYYLAERVDHDESSIRTTIEVLTSLSLLNTNGDREQQSLSNFAQQVSDIRRDRRDKLMEDIQKELTSFSSNSDKGTFSLDNHEATGLFSLSNYNVDNTKPKYDAEKMQYTWDNTGFHGSQAYLSIDR